MDPIKMISQQPSSTFIGRCLQNAPLPRHKILQALRGDLEGTHRATLRNHTFVHQRYRLEIDDPRHIYDIPEINIKQANDCCNKTIPIYICHNHRGNVNQSSSVLLFALHNWLYQQWFRPYRSNIEWGQFIAKIFECTIPFKYLRPDCLTKWQGLGDSPEDVIDMTIRLNRLVCDRIETSQKHILSEERPDSTRCNGLVPEQSFRDLQRDQSCFILQPLFRAIMIVIQEQSFTIDMTDIGGLMVYLVLTGVEHGLSSPISLESVEKDLASKSIYDREGRLRAICTTLKTAYTFIRELECREEAAFWQRPDPVQDSKGLRAGYLTTAESLQGLADELGWRSEWEPLEYPSSRWVDTTLTPKWEGGGEHWDRIMRKQEEVRREIALEDRDRLLKSNYQKDLEQR